MKTILEFIGAWLVGAFIYAWIGIWIGAFLHTPDWVVLAWAAVLSLLSSVGFFGTH